MLTQNLAKHGYNVQCEESAINHVESDVQAGIRARGGVISRSRHSQKTVPRVVRAQDMLKLPQIQAC